LLELINFNS